MGVGDDLDLAQVPGREHRFVCEPARRPGLDEGLLGGEPGRQPPSACLVDGADLGTLAGAEGPQLEPGPGRIELFGERVHVDQIDAHPDHAHAGSPVR